jgi:iron complex transport system ATP-binding protein
MPVIDYVMLGRAPHLGRFGAESDLDIAAANQALGDLGLVSFARRPVDELSGGERQRVVIARALAQSAPILLLDEPTSALDVGVRMEVLDHIDSIRRGGGLTVISAVHDLTLAAQFCDRLVMLARGAVVAEGSAETVLTAETIGRHYGARVRVISDDGGVIVVPIRGRDPRDSIEAGSIGHVMESRKPPIAHV